MIILLLFAILLLPAPISAQADAPVYTDAVMLRYDGQSTNGTIAPLVCNSAQTPTDALPVSVSVNGETVTLDAPSIPAQNCAAVFDASSDFTTFGITAAGTYTVSVSVDAHTLEADVTIDAITPTGTEADFDAYANCRANNPHSECFANILDAPSSDPHEIRYQMGTFAAVGPAAYETLIPLYAVDMQICTTNIADYLALELPPLVSRRLLIAEGYSGSFAGDTYIQTLLSESTMDEFIDRARDEWWPFLIDGGCLDPHETTHIFVNNTPIPGWLNEGLATFMQDTERTNHSEPFPTQCNDETFVSSYFGAEMEIPYLSLQNSAYNLEEPTIHYYYTGACFWDHLANTYGQEAIQQIVNDLITYRDPAFNGCSIDPPRPDVAFLRDIVMPIVGDEIAVYTQEHFDFSTDYTGCEF